MIASQSADPSASPIFRVDWEVLEPSSTVLQTAAKPSQLPVRPFFVAPSGRCGAPTATKKARCSWGGTPGQTDLRRCPIGRYGQSRVPSGCVAGFRTANIANVAAIPVGRWPKPSDGLREWPSNMVNVPVVLASVGDTEDLLLQHRVLRLNKLLDAKSATSFARNFHFLAHGSFLSATVKAHAEIVERAPRSLLQ